MSDQPFLDYSRRFRRRTPGGSAAPNEHSWIPRPRAHNHRQLDEAFEAEKWEANKHANDGEPIAIVDSGSRIAVKASSVAFPPTNQFRFWVKAIPLNGDGTPQTSASAPGGWAEPTSYSSVTGTGLTKTFVYEATSPAPKHRWLVSIPPQHPTHGNAASNQLQVFVPRER